MLEHLLLDVGNFSEQLVYQLDRETQERLIERYYGLDDAFCREVVGKKLREGNNRIVLLGDTLSMFGIFSFNLPELRPNKRG